MRDIAFARPRGNMMPLKKPRLLNLAAGVSLLLAVAIVVLWVRSYGRHEGLAHFSHTATERVAWNVESAYSSLYLSVWRSAEKAP